MNQYEPISSAYLAGAIQLRSAVADLSPDALDFSLNKDSWSIRQIVHHVADGDALWAVCVKAALGPNPQPFDLYWYWQIEQDEWTRHWAYADRPIESSLALLQFSRQHIVELLAAIPDALNRSVSYQFPGRPMREITIGRVLEMQSNHVAEHVDEILKIRRLYEN